MLPNAGVLQKKEGGSTTHLADPLLFGLFRAIIFIVLRHFKETMSPTNQQPGTTDDVPICECIKVVEVVATGVSFFRGYERSTKDSLSFGNVHCHTYLLHTFPNFKWFA
jgi:hypothetical protein